MKRIFDPRVMLILSITVFGSIGLFVKAIPLASGEIALYRAILAAALIGIVRLITRQRISFKNKKRASVASYLGSRYGL